MTIYAIGTSHTYGECRDLPGDKVERPWTSIMAERLGIDVINYGRPGVNNLQLVEMAQHLCENDKPEMIIAEMRWQPYPLLIEKHDTSEDYTTDLFSATRHNQSGNDKYRYQYYPLYRAQILTEDQLKKISWLNNYPEQKARDIIGYARINFLHNVIQNQNLLQSLSNMHHITSICKFYNVPVKIFVWGGTPFDVVSDAEVNLNGIDTFKFFSSGMPFIIYAEKTKSRKWIEEYTCSCDHMMQPVHEFFVDTVIDEVKQILNI
jgi:hypothetical protein